MASQALQVVATRIRRDQQRWERDRRRVCDEVGSALSRLGPRHGLRRAFLFGSVVWGGFCDRSDVDVLVWGVSAVQEHELAADLERCVGRPVHLVRAGRAPATLIARVLGDGQELRVG
jgi:predicted nucleotidyltransferase